MFAQSEPTSVSTQTDFGFWQGMLKTATEIYGVIAINESQKELEAVKAEQQQEQSQGEMAPNQPIIVEVDAGSTGASLKIPSWVFPVAIAVGGWIVLKGFLR